MKTVKPDEAVWFSDIFDQFVSAAETAVLGKSHVIRLAYVTLFSGGHLLLEDVPGTGKTSLARAMSQSISGSSNRIQFTPDLLPGDITGVSVFDQKSGDFEFHRGPLFSNILLADEINRASPKTQSALLEVMEEHQVTVDGITHLVDLPFMVIATQNPVEHAGTYRLPEAQLDRFLIRTSLGYPDHQTLIRILENHGSVSMEGEIAPVVSAALVAELVKLARTVHVDASIFDYIARIIEQTRLAPEVKLGASVRAGVSLLAASKTLAAANGRHFVIPDDVKALAEPVLAHRMILETEAEFDAVTTGSVVSRILIDIPAPSERVIE